MSSSTLKIIAIVAMFMDHYAAIFLVNHPLYFLFRFIGRFTFPIMCYLIVQGYKHTRNKKKYATRLFIFALLSEIPFDYAFFGHVGFEYQNVFFTLFLGLMTVWVYDELKTKNNKYYTFVPLISVLISLFINADYYFFGILIIFYIYKSSTLKQQFISFVLINFLLTFATTPTLVGLLTNSQLYAPLAFIPIYYYNGKRGLSLKYIFYVFYPLHLLFLGYLKHILLN